MNTCEQAIFENKFHLDSKVEAYLIIVGSTRSARQAESWAASYKIISMGDKKKLFLKQTKPYQYLHWHTP